MEHSFLQLRDVYCCLLARCSSESIFLCKWKKSCTSYLGMTRLDSFPNLKLLNSFGDISSYWMERIVSVDLFNCVSLKEALMCVLMMFYHKKIHSFPNSDRTTFLNLAKIMTSQDVKIQKFTGYNSPFSSF